MAGANFDPIEITRLFVFGFGTDTPPPPDNYNEHIRSRNATPESITYSMSEYMMNGGGRFAYPSLFPAVEKFFNGEIPERENGYTAEEIRGILGLTSNDLNIDISQYGTGIGSADHANRCWIFGNGSFILDVSKATFSVNNGIKKIEGLEVKAIEDNFDFQSLPGSLSQLINDTINSPTFDPYGLSRGLVTINFDNTVGKLYSTYTQENFQADQKLEVDVNRPTDEGLKSLALNGGIKYFQNIASDPFLSYRRGSLNVIYGHPESENIPLVTIRGLEGSLIVGGAGDDTFNPRLFDDELDGGDGSDTAVYRGAKDEYDIQDLPDGSQRISDKIPSRDGTDILKNIEKIVFQKGLAQDIAFVIDTTKSMSDDIDEVKARASEIINIVLGEKSDSPDSVSPDKTNSGGSRIAVVGYNDPGTDIFLPFTDQPDIEQRKTAALNAINSISVGGGGDLPEVVNTGLLRALSGEAGKWRAEADVRRIILFGDAPPKDTELRAQVLALASNVGNSVSASSLPSSMSITGDIKTSNIASNLAVTRFALQTDNQAKIPVEIFTILIGNDSRTAADFQSLATATGGKALNAADASEIVDVIIEALGTSAQNQTVSITTPTQNIINGSPSNDLLLGYRGNNILIGLEGNDTLYGGKDNDMVDGGVGDDQVWGDLGQDVLIGGPGNDTFFITGNSALGLPEQADVITDFQPGDTIGLASGLLLNQLVFEPITLQLNGGLPTVSTAIKLNESYLAIVQGVETSTLTPNVFIGV